MIVDYNAKISARSRTPHIGIRVLCSPRAENGTRVEYPLKPGVQDIPDAVWAALREAPQIGYDPEAKSGSEYKGHLVRLGMLTVLGARFDITKKTPAEAEAMIERTIDPKVLRSWRAAIQKRGDESWDSASRLLDEQIREVTTDPAGNPVTPRTLTIPQSEHSPPPAA